jgi:hypothetical protein
MTVVFYVREKLTAKDKKRAGPVIQKWLDALFDEGDIRWEPLFAKIEDVSRKTRPPGLVTIYRCPRTAGETGEYDRWTSWSYDHDISFGLESCHGRRIMARVWPNDIEVVPAAFGDEYDEGMSEVILRPGKYIVVPANTFQELSKYPPVSPPNYFYPL